MWEYDTLEVLQDFVREPMSDRTIQMHRLLEFSQDMLMDAELLLNELIKRDKQQINRKK